MANKHAVVIAGDARMFEQASHTYSHMIADADVFVSVWSTSNYQHKARPSLRFKNGPFTHELFESKLNCKVVESCIEDYLPRKWDEFGYNSNYLHRLRQGVEMVRRHGPYDTVFFTRPDIWFHEFNPLNEAVRSVQKGQFVTIWSDSYAVHQINKLQDVLFGVHFDDMDKAVPTVHRYAPFKHGDWHNFFCRFVLESGLQVINIDDVHLLILRPSIDDPNLEITNWTQALRLSDIWSYHNVIRMINDHGIEQTMRSWGPHAVLQSVHYLADLEHARRESIQSDPT